MIVMARCPLNATVTRKTVLGLVSDTISVTTAIMIMIIIIAGPQ